MNMYIPIHIYNPVNVISTIASSINLPLHLSVSSSVVLVEGYFDVLSAQEFGMPNVLATMGTAVSITQVCLYFYVCM